MSVKKAAIISGGVVTNVVVVDSNHLPTIPNMHIIDVDDAEIEIGWTYTNGEFSKPAVPIGDLRLMRVSALRDNCASAITGGFLSSALGSPHTYPSEPTDQTNLMGSVVASMLPSAIEEGWSTPFWCKNEDGEWAFRAHTSIQIQQVGEDGKAHVVACQTRLDELTAQVTEATSAGAIGEISW